MAITYLFGTVNVIPEREESIRAEGHAFQLCKPLFSLSLEHINQYHHLQPREGVVPHSPENGVSPTAQRMGCPLQPREWGVPHSPENGVSPTAQRMGPPPLLRKWVVSHSPQNESFLAPETFQDILVITCNMQEF